MGEDMNNIEKNYAAAEIILVNRSNWEEKGMYLYPITEVILRNCYNPEEHRTFIVNNDGEWIEEKI